MADEAVDGDDVRRVARAPPRGYEAPARGRVYVETDPVMSRAGRHTVERLVADARARPG